MITMLHEKILILKYTAILSQGKPHPGKEARLAVNREAP